MEKENYIKVLVEYQTIMVNDKDVYLYGMKCKYKDKKVKLLRNGKSTYDIIIVADVLMIDNNVYFKSLHNDYLRILPTDTVIIDSEEDWRKVYED